MSFEFTGDPYAAQLRAAKAEGELAAVMDALREFAEENGFNPELEPRDLLAKAAGAFRSCAAMSDARYAEIQGLRAEMEAMRPRLMPEGMEWPVFEDGEPVRIGDEFEDANGKRQIARSIQFTANTVILFFDDGISTETYYNGRRVKRPAVLAADGEPLEAGQTVYHTDTGREYRIHSINDDGKGAFVYNNSLGQDAAGLHLCPVGNLTHHRPVLDADGNRIEPAMDVWWVCEGDERGIHAEKLHVESIGDDGFVTCSPFNGGTWVELNSTELYVHKPVLDADGVLIKKGDTVWCVATDEELTDMSIIRACWSKMRKKLTVKSFITDAHGDKWADFEETSPYAKTCYLTHERPDSWQRIEEDAGCTATKYNERRGTIFTTKQQVARDLVRRCRALAERERSE